MRASRQRGSLTFIALGVVSVALLGPVSAALADPGSPNLTVASQAVYPAPPRPASVHSSYGPVKLGDLDPGGGGNRATGGHGGPTASAASGLPFTGLAAALMLAVGLVAVASGAALRVAAQRKDRLRTAGPSFSG
jgi:hypothetical protein